MKTSRIKRFYPAVAAVVFFLLPFTSCNDDDNNNVDLIRRSTVTLSGAKEVPPNNSTGSGTAQIDYNVSKKTISYRLDWSLGSLTEVTTAMHFHGAANGTDTTSSPIVIPITGFSPLYSGTVSGTTRQLTDEESDQLLSGKWYVNVHSSTYPNGEIRGNIKF